MSSVLYCVLTYLYFVELNNFIRKLGRPVFLLICMTSALFNFLVVAESLNNKMDRKLFLIFVFFVTLVSCIDEQRLLTRLLAVEDGMDQCQKNNEINSVAIEENARTLNETKEIVEDQKIKLQEQENAQR